MKKFALSIFTLLTLCIAATQAAPVSVESARRAGLNFLTMTEGRSEDTRLELVYEAIGKQGITSYYVFAVNDTGFIAIGAEDRFVPVLAFCEDTRFDTATMPDYIRSWFEVYRNCIAFGVERDDMGLRPEESERVKGEWKALLSGDPTFYAKRGQKSVPNLVETRWGQGNGYNLYCPNYTQASTGNGHALVGCVATAMAQILRYWRYGVGFGSHSYSCTYYGRLSMKFDTATYDFNNMPLTAPTNPQTETAVKRRHHISQLCYHCGIANDMTYESPSYQGGSGTQTANVPDALKHFGYYGAYILSKSSNENSWEDLLRNELDHRRPMEYSGHSQTEGGHAFICDGYKESTSQYHFNWGWSGSYNGYYTLTTMKGFTYSQQAVMNIVPSYLCNTDTFYISANAEQKVGNDGSSWAKANPNLHNALSARGMYKSGYILVKEGTYYGDTSLLRKDAAFIITPGVKVYGGFAGNERTIDQRNPAEHPTILDGRGSQRVANADNTMTKIAYVHDLIFQNGQANNGAGVYSTKNVTFDGCTFRNNTGQNGAGLYMESGTVRRCYFHGNNSSSSSALYVKQGDVKNCLIANNRGGGVTTTAAANLINLTVVSNAGIGITLGSSTVLRNSIIWNNNTQLSGGTTSNITYNAVMSTSPSSTGNITLSSNNNDSDGPHFVNPKTARGIVTSEGDWHISNASSPCYNSGMPDDDGTYKWDLDNRTRTQHGRVDIGCYEFKNLDIESNSQAAIKLYPNPTYGSVTFDGIPAGTTVTVYDAAGRCVTTATAVTGSLTITLPATGIYIARTSIGTTHKLISVDR
ncbi:MAG: C10 family peptidase [Bacteroidales bacterium]|nr:C10 family peptidase [Bacteroidales bacterium]